MSVDFAELTRPQIGEAHKFPEKLTFETASKFLIDEGKRRIKDNTVKKGLKFHTLDNHIEPLERHLDKVSEILDLNPSERILLNIMIAWHDVVMDSDPADPSDITSTITRKRGALKGDLPSGEKGNEARSAAELLNYMRAINTKKKVFSDEMMETVYLGIVYTYPGVNTGKDNSLPKFKEYKYYSEITTDSPSIIGVLDDLEKKGIDRGVQFYQPHLETKLEKGEVVPRAALAMALLDLGTGGMSESEEFFTEGNQEFAELYTNISNPINNVRLTDSANKDAESDRMKVKEIALRWIKGQTSFLVWQMLRYEKIAFLLQKNGQFDKEKRQKYRAVFNRFAENISAADERRKVLEHKYNEINTAHGSAKASEFLLKSIGIKTS